MNKRIVALLATIIFIGTHVYPPIHAHPITINGENGSYWKRFTQYCIVYALGGVLIIATLTE